MQYINKSVCRGVAGRRARGWKPLGIVLHNDAGSMNPEAYVNWLAGKTPTQLQSGFAHYYGNRNQMARVEDTYNGAWHVANYNGNMDYVGYEVCESLKVSDKDFIANEEAVFQQAAKDMKDWGLTPSRSTVKIHRRFVPTTCPHRSWDLHVGKGAADTNANRNKMEDYFIARIKHYMNGGTSSGSNSGSNSGSKPSTGGNKITNTTKFANGDKVKVLAKATHYQTGQSIPSFVKGQTYTVKQSKTVNQSASKYAFLLDGVNSWFLAQDLQKVSGASTGYAAKKVGDTVTVQSFATRYQTGEPIASFVKGKKYKISQVKNVKQSKSKRAYLLSGINSWVLEQDVK